MNQKRNSQIASLHKSGKTLDEIADRFRTSRVRVQHIVDTARLAKKRKKRVQSYHGKIRLTDDLDKKWDAGTLVEGLNLPYRVEDVLLSHFEHERRKQLSLRDFMAVVINDEPIDPAIPFVLTPVFKIKGVGHYGFRDILASLTSMNMGETCNREWKRRLSILEEYGWLKARLSFSAS